tara:strand:- start:296 stop:643 length:348 start_codon:yes stop_codon:yes gene_type:complete
MSKELDQSGVYEDISSEPTPFSKQVRAWEVRIDNPLSEDPTLLYRTEKVLLDEYGKLIYREDRRKTKDVSCKFSSVSTNTITFIDPVSQKEITLSGAGVAESISIFFAKLWKEEF